MKIDNRIYPFVMIILSMIISGCLSKPFEEYSDHFYSYKTKDQRNGFTYILYLGEEGEAGHHSAAQSEHSSKIPQRQRQSAKEGAKSSKKRKAGTDDFMSLSFRMEEEAFKRLETLLAKKAFCKNEADYTSNEYTWLRYTIKGTCD